MTPLLFNRKQAAKMLSISVVSLDRYVKAGEIRATRVGRRVLFDKFELHMFCNRHLMELR